MRFPKSGNALLVYITCSHCIIMSKRVTIMIDDDLDKKLRLRQAKMIQQNQTSFSYSKTLNEVLRKSL